jgi:CheY-like chemotaxis protein
MLRRIDLIERVLYFVASSQRLMRQWSAVLGGKHSARILVVQRWTIDLDPIEQSLRASGVDAAITRVDFAAALDAALTHERFDAVIFDPSTPDLTREAVEGCLRQHGRDIPIVLLDDTRTIGEQLARLLAPGRN